MTKRTHSEICTEIAAVDANLAPSAYRDELRATAKELVAAGKGLLACDEPPHVLPTRMKMCWSKPEECNEEWRIGYRELLFTTPGLSQYVSGVILHEETVHQSMSASKGAEKQTVPHMLKSLGIVPGVKVDRGFNKMMGSQETHTQGLDDLGDRCKKYYSLGCRFAKWRSPLHIGPGMPSETAIRIECDGLARYAAICQENGLMPIVEPDVVMDGAHSIEVSAKITKHVLIQTFASLDRHNVDVEGILIKTNMVRPGEKSTNPECPELVGAATVKVFGSCLPVNLPGIVFLSGGMSEEFATSALAAINAHEDRKKLPWPLTFSYGRALQHSARVNWQGNPDNFQKAQTALLERARVNSEASLGRYAESAATNGSTTTSLHVEGGNKY
jgi:fructose-bisphosphate aldolase class I